MTVPNGLIAPSQSLPLGPAVYVPMPAGVDVARVNKVLRNVGAEAFEDKTLRPLLLDAPTAMGVESFEVNDVHMRMVARTLPGKQFDVARELRARVAVALQREGLAPAGPSATGPGSSCARRCHDAAAPAGATRPSCWCCVSGRV